MIDFFERRRERRLAQTRTEHPSEVDEIERIGHLVHMCPDEVDELILDIRRKPYIPYHALSSVMTTLTSLCIFDAIDYIKLITHPGGSVSPLEQGMTLAGASFISGAIYNLTHIAHYYIRERNFTQAIQNVQKKIHK